MKSLASSSSSASAREVWLLWTQRAYWVLLLAITPVLLPPNLLWARSGRALVGIPYFRAEAAWGLLVFGLLVLLATRRDVEIADILASIPRIIGPLKLLWPFLLLVLLSTFVGNQGPGSSALGSADRADGTLMVLAWFGLVPVSTGLARWGKREPRIWLGALAAGGALTSMWVLLQSIGRDPLTALTREHFQLNLPAGAFGHSAIAEAYLGMCLLVLLSAWSDTGSLGWPELVITAVVSVGMGAAGGRAGLLGFAVALMLLGGMTFWRRRGRLSLVSLVAAAIVGGLAGYAVSPHAHTKAAAALSGSDASATHRLIAWTVGAKVVAHYPLMGVGPDNFQNVLWDFASPDQQRALMTELIGFAPKQGSYKVSGNVVVYSDPTTGQIKNSLLRWDKAHNYFLDMALSTGLPSLLLFLGFLVSSIWLLLQSPSSVERGIGLALVVFSVWGLFWFYSVALDPIVWGLVGMGLGLYGRRTADSMGTA